jgi:hypothetical protein
MLLTTRALRTSFAGITGLTGRDGSSPADGTGIVASGRRGGAQPDLLARAQAGESGHENRDRQAEPLEDLLD